MKSRLPCLLRLTLVLVGILTTFALAALFAYILADRTNGSIVSSGETRSYLLYVPSTYSPAKPAPLVISLHGYLGWPAHQMRISGWDALADEYGFIVVYPAGTGFPKHWRTRGEAGSDADPMIDVTFISDLIDKLEGEYNLDPRRIYVNGISNGGGMSFVLSCKLSDRIAAFGAISGAYLLTWERCDPSRRVPALIVHGTADPIVPYEGGPSWAFDLPFPRVPDWVDEMARRNGCTDAPVASPAHGDVTGIQYEQCAADVIFYTVAGGGHTWPGGGDIPAFIAGHTTQHLDATGVLWDFFQAHPLP